MGATRAIASVLRRGCQCALELAGYVSLDDGATWTWQSTAGLDPARADGADPEAFGLFLDIPEPRIILRKIGLSVNIAARDSFGVEVEFR